MEADLLVGPLLILDGAWEAQRDQAATQEMAEDGKKSLPNRVAGQGG